MRMLVNFVIFLLAAKQITGTRCYECYSCPFAQIPGEISADVVECKDTSAQCVTIVTTLAVETSVFREGPAVFPVDRTCTTPGMLDCFNGTLGSDTCYSFHPADDLDKITEIKKCIFNKQSSASRQKQSNVTDTDTVATTMDPQLESEDIIDYDEYMNSNKENNTASPSSQTLTIADSQGAKESSVPVSSISSYQPRPSIYIPNSYCVCTGDMCNDKSVKELGLEKLDIVGESRSNRNGQEAKVTPSEYNAWKVLLTTTFLHLATFLW